MNKNIDYVPTDFEAERASNAYLMSLLAVMVGMPLPIINLIASLIYFFSNRRSSYFVRWHCTQTLLSQVTLVVCNSIGFTYTLSIVLGTNKLSNNYIAYMLTIILFNLTEFVITIRAAIRTRKGLHVEWLFWGEITNLICKPDIDKVNSFEYKTK